MRGYSQSTAVGRVQSGELDEIFIPRSPRAGCAGVILCHGSGSPQGFIDPVNQPSSARLAAAIAYEGIPCIAGDFGNQAWGNDTVLSRIDAAWTLLKSRAPSINANKMSLLGASMGGAAVARYSQANPTKVASVIGIIPLFDLKTFYTLNTFGTQAEIAGAWGVAPGAALPASADVATRVALAKGIPHLIGYSSADAVVLPAWVTAYASVVGASPIITDSTFGHSDQAVGGMSIPTVIKFLMTHGS